MGELIDWARRSYLELIRDHVSESLIINVSYKDIRFEFSSRYSAIESFVSVEIVSGCNAGLFLLESDEIRNANLLLNIFQNVRLLDCLRRR